MMFNSKATFYELCDACKKPLVNRRNLIIFRTKLGVGAGLITVGGVFVGSALLPLVGFSSAGVTGGSVAASVQSTIGTVAAGSTFAGLQSLGATGIGNLLFGAVGSVAGGGGALFIMRKIAGRLGWCIHREKINAKL